MGNYSDIQSLNLEVFEATINLKYLIYFVTVEIFKHI